MSEFYSKEKIIENHMISVDLRRDSKASPAHTHGFLEIIYITSGSAIYHHTDKHLPIKEGDYFFVDYGFTHRITDKTQNFEVITCAFVPEFIDNSLIGCSGIVDVFKNYSVNLLPSPIGNFYSFSDESGEILNILKAMIVEYNEKKPGFLSFLRSYLIQLLILTIRTFDIVIENLDERISKIIDYISVNYHEEITLSSICENYHCSISNISMLFKSQVGETFTEYLRKTRMEAAGHLLLNTGKSIDEVANRIGYNDVKSFREHFKEHFGISPLKFRKTFNQKVK